MPEERFSNEAYKIVDLAFKLRAANGHIGLETAVIIVLASLEQAEKALDEDGND